MITQEEKEQLISFDTSMLLHLRNIDFKSDLGYTLKEELKKRYLTAREGGVDFHIDVVLSAPTQSQVQKYIRDKHGIHILIIPTVTNDWTFKTINVLSERDNDIIKGIKSVSDLPPYKEVSGNDYNIYEKALEKALYETIKII